MNEFNLIPATHLKDWRVQKPGEEISRFSIKNLEQSLWWWRQWYPATLLKRKRAPFSSGFVEEIERLVKDNGQTLKVTVEHYARMSIEHRAFLYEFDARVSGSFRFGHPFPVLMRTAPALVEKIGNIELVKNLGPWTDLEQIFSEFADATKHGNSKPRKQPHPWHILEERDKQIFLGEKLSDTHRSQWSKFLKGCYEPYAKVIYSPDILRSDPK